MTTKTKASPVRFYLNLETNSVYERVPDSQWSAKLEAWKDCYREVRRGANYGEGTGSNYLHPVVPSPLPYGHVTFDRRRACYREGCYSEMPQPVWSDGVACAYAGQRIAWYVPDPCCISGRNYRYGTVISAEQTPDGKPALLVQADNGKVIVDIYSIA